MSYMMHGSDPAGVTIWGDTTGTPPLICSNNYYDASSAYGWAYPNSITPAGGWATLNNVDLISTQTMTPEGAATITVLNIAPVVAGGTTIVSGMFCNGEPNAITLAVDGGAVANTSSIQLTSGYGGYGAGFFAASFPTPATLGSHTVAVHGTGPESGVTETVAFVVMPTTAPSISVNTPAAGITEGTPITITGSYANGAPVQLTYIVDGVGPQLNAAAAISGGAFSFDIAAPPCINSANGGNPISLNNDGHTITITAVGAGNSAQATTGSFPTISAPTLTIVTPFSDTNAVLPLTISGGFGGPIPTGLTYSVDGGPSLPAPSPVIANCNWSFSIPAPPIGNSHTITVTGTGPNTAFATCAPFRTAAQLFAPGPPGVPAALLTTADLIAVSWTAPTTGSPVDSYKLESSPHGSGIWTVAAAGTASLIFIAPNLAPSTSYDFQVSATNLAGTSAFATNTAGISTTSGFLDGYVGRPAVTSPQLPGILAGYPARPVWKVAGVDYGVGIATGTTLTDWETLSGTGITVGANYVEFNGVPSPVVNAVDFSLHGGAVLLFYNGSNNASVTNCKFGGASISTTSAIGTDLLSAGLAVTGCEFDAGSTLSVASIWARGGGTTTVEYCLSLSDNILLLCGDDGGVVNLSWNVVQGEYLYKGGSGSLATAQPTITFNTVYASAVSAYVSVAVDLLGSGGTITSPIVSNNVLIALASTALTQGYGVHGAAAIGAALLFENWVDSSGGYGAFYGSSFPAWVVVQNTNLPTGTALPVP